MQGERGAGLEVEDGAITRQAHDINFLPGYGLPPAQPLCDNDAFWSEPDQAQVEAVDKEHSGAKCRDSAYQND